MVKCVAFLLLVIVPCVAGLAQSPNPQAPLFANSASDSRFLLQVKVDGNDTMMLVDTGAGASAISVAIAQQCVTDIECGIDRLHVDITGQEHYSGVSSVRSFMIPKLGVQSLQDHEINVLSNQTRYEGILGLRELTRWGAVIDCGTRCLALHPHGDYKPPVGWQSIKLGRDSGGNHLLMPVTVRRQTGLFCVDTGASRTAVESEFAARAGVVFSNHTVGIRSLIARCGLVSDLTCANTLPIGPIACVGLDLSKLNAILKSECERPLQGILGIDQLHRIGAIIDCHQSTIWFQPNAGQRFSQAPVSNEEIENAVSGLVQFGDSFLSARDADAKISFTDAMSSVCRARRLGIIR